MRKCVVGMFLGHSGHNHHYNIDDGLRSIIA